MPVGAQEEGILCDPDANHQLPLWKVQERCWRREAIQQQLSPFLKMRPPTVQIFSPIVGGFNAARCQNLRRIAMAAAKKRWTISDLTGVEPPSKETRAILYAGNVLMETSTPSVRANVVLQWTEEFAPTLGLEANRGEDRDPSPEVWKSLKGRLGVWATPRPVDWNAFDEPIFFLCRQMDLNPAETAVLQLVLDYEAFKPVRELWNRLSNSEGLGSHLRLDVELIGHLTGYLPSVISSILEPHEPLRSSGLVRLDGNGALQVLSRLLAVICEQPEGYVDLRPALIGAIQHPTVSLADFLHLGDQLHGVLAVLRAALTDCTKGVVVILYGAPSQLRTQLAVTMAAELGVPIRSVGEGDVAGEKIDPSERLSQLQLAQRLMRDSEPGLLLFEDVEDIFGCQADSRGKRRAEQKVEARAFLYRLLIGTAPLIMTAKSLDSFGAEVLRHAFCLEVEVPQA